MVRWQEVWGFMPLKDIGRVSNFIGDSRSGFDEYLSQLKPGELKSKELFYFVASMRLLGKDVSCVAEELAHRENPNHTFGPHEPVITPTDFGFDEVDAPKILENTFYSRQSLRLLGRNPDPVHVSQRPNDIEDVFHRVAINGACYGNADEIVSFLTPLYRDWGFSANKSCEPEPISTFQGLYVLDAIGKLAMVDKGAVSYFLTRFITSNTRPYLLHSLCGLELLSVELPKVTPPLKLNQDLKQTYQCLATLYMTV